jgi:UDPglucose 6-dehydrogenase
MSSNMQLTESNESEPQEFDHNFQVSSSDYARSLKIMQVGCGVVGGAYVRAFKNHGLDMVGVDIVPDILVDLKNDGITAYHPQDVPDDLQVDVVLISVPTLLIKEINRLDMKYVDSTLTLMTKIVKQSKERCPIIILRSTLPPGRTLQYKQDLQNMLGDDRNCFRMAFQPEFLRAKSAYDDAFSPWRVVIGLDHNEAYFEQTKQELISLFTTFVNHDMIYIINIEEAEFQKLVHNCYNGMKITFANVMHGIAQGQPYDIDAHKVLQIVSNTAEGFLNKNYGLTPGKPYGGTCLPKDIPELTSLAPIDSPYHAFLNNITIVNKYVAETTHETSCIDGLNWVSNSFLSEATQNTIT